MQLAFIDLQPADITTSSAPHQPSLTATGANFNNVNRITLSWTGSVNGTATWNVGDANWNSKVIIHSATSMTLRPIVVAAGDPPGTTNWTVTLRDTNGATASRSLTVTYSQCSYSLSASSASFPAVGGSGSVAMTTSSPNCPWTAVSSDPSWLRPSPSTASGAGNGAINYTVDANQAIDSRVGSLSVAGRSLTVNQDGVAPPSAPQISGLQITPTSVPSNATSTQTFSFSFSATNQSLNGGHVEVGSEFSSGNTSGFTKSIPSEVSMSGSTITFQSDLTTFAASTSVRRTVRLVDGAGQVSNALQATTTIQAPSGGIFGRVTRSGTGLSGASIQLSGAATASTTTDGNGNYSFTNLSSGSYIVTPAQSGCTFGPLSRSVQVSGSAVTGQDFDANCTPSTFTLSLSKSGSGSGSVTSDPAGINCGVSCPSTSASFAQNTPIVLSANPASGSTFSSWGGDCVGQGNPCNLTMNSPKSATASFVSSPSTVSVTITTSPPGLRVIVDNTTYTAPQVFNWPSGSTHTVGTLVDQLSPDQRTAYTFTSWSNGGAETHQFSATQNTTVTAAFLSRYLLTTAVSGNGSISQDPGGAWHNAGQSVRLTADPGPSASFSSWSGDCAGQQNPCNITMNAPKTVTANFTSTPSTVVVTLATSPPGLLVTADDTSYTAPKTLSWTVGTTHAIGTPSPQFSGDQRTRYTFGFWSDGGAQSHQFNAPASNTAYTASFATHLLLDTTVSPPSGGSISLNPGGFNGPWYVQGQSIQLTATPAAGRVFSSWSGDCAGQSNPCTLMINAPKTATANFSTTPTLGSISGRVTRSGSGFAGAGVGLAGPVNTGRTTDANGDFSFTDLPAGSYTVAAASSGCTFTPSSHTVSVSGNTVSGQDFAATCASAPNQPTNLSALALSTTEISLAWQDNSSNEDGFKVERRIGSGGYSQITTRGPSVNGYIDGGLSAATQYCYRVRAYNGVGDSGYSNEACATTQTNPLPPGSFTLFTPTKTCPGKIPAIHLNWSASTGAAHYDLYRDGSLYPAGAGNTTTSFTNTGSNVSFGSFYSYFVRAVGPTGLPRDSNQQTTQATCQVTVGGTGGVGLKLRQCADTNDAMCPVIATLSDGTVMTIVGGPVTADGFSWYAIQGPAGTGWAAGNWLIP